MKTKNKVFILALCAIFFSPFLWRGFGGEASANNLSISNVSVSGTTLTFTISWDNSWYVSSPPYNWDAVWVFIKYKKCADPDWSHAQINNSGTFSFGGGATNLQFETVSDGMGVFIKRSNTNMGTGNITATECNVPLSIAPDDYNFKVFGIEMVKVKQEDFQVGDGGSSNCFNSITIDANYETNGFANALTTLGGTNTVNGAMSGNYPLGYDEFYCMKYEISQEQYVDFLNTLTYAQQTTRTAVAPSSNTTYFALTGGTAPVARNGVKIMASGDAGTSTPAQYGLDLSDNDVCYETDDGMAIACNYLSWGDLEAYLDWAALRPMTETEFEKVCRGPAARVNREYPWGLSPITSYGTVNFPSCWGNYTYSFGYYSNATNNCAAVAYPSMDMASTAYMNYGGAYNESTTQVGQATKVGVAVVGGAGPMRVGIGADHTSCTRVSGGATYYGVLDMAGNVLEHVVSTKAAGATYTGVLGDGALKADGNTDLSAVDGGFWPSYSTAAGTGLRGGGWNTATVENVSTQFSPLLRNIYGYGGPIGFSGTLCATTLMYGYTYLYTSSRILATTENATRGNSYGGRGVR